MASFSSSSPGATQPTRGYVICTTPRAGSHLLCVSLASTGALGAPHAYFDADPIKAGEWIDRLKIISDRDYVEKVLVAGGAQSGIFGLKLQWRQIEEMGRRLALAEGTETPGDIVDVFERLQRRAGPLDFVWVRRRNKVAQAISHYRGFPDDLGQQRPSFVGDSAANDGVSFDFAAIDLYREKLETLDSYWFDYFTATRRKVLVVEYEEFTCGPEQFQQTIFEIARFLGVQINHKEVSPPILRTQSDAVSIEWEARFKRMKASGKRPGKLKAAVPDAERSGELAALVAYDLSPHLGIRISAASSRRKWMDETLRRSAYRCLPMTIANQHGWLLHTPCALRARWNGGQGLDSLQIEYSPAGATPFASSHFGGGLLTFAINYLFRTPPGVNLLVRGPANSPKDGIYPLEGVVETDWSEATFTMNWRFTRSDHWVTFEEDEPFAMITPMRRGYLEHFEPEIRPIANDPNLMTGYSAWWRSRGQFNQDLQEPNTLARERGWQGHYLRGESPSGAKASEHQTGLALREFVERSE